MRCFAPIRLPIVLFIAALWFLPAFAAPPQIDPVYGPLPVFELHSGFWINLHHRLYEEARERRSGASGDAAKSGKAGKPTLQVAPGAKIALSAAEQRAWDDAVSYYVANYADKDLLFSTELVLLKNQLGDFETCEELSGAKKRTCDAGLPGKLTQILDAAGPVYRARRWSADDRANRAWIKRVAPLVREQGVGLSHRLADIYQTRWPAERIRVDVSAVANNAGAYTTLDPLRVTIASTDARNQGAAALEVLFHEASHGIATPVEQAIARECRQREKPIPRDLWHALIFYTTGEVIKPVMDTEDDATNDRALPTGSGGSNAPPADKRSLEEAQYTPYAIREGLYRRGWESYLQILTNYWQPYLEGRVTFDDAIAHMVSAL
ncbi:MAG: hypothetical protein JWO71_1237 [Candidatus Acidoferrum typicum]|nr:hypothetical protein [Candidatus Acidoferrum typicum]